MASFANNKKNTLKLDLKQYISSKSAIRGYNMFILYLNLHHIHQKGLS